MYSFQELGLVMFKGHYSDYYLVFYPPNVGWLLLLETTLPSISESWLSLPGLWLLCFLYPPHLFLGHWPQSRISSDRKYQVPFQKYHPLLLPLHLPQRPCHSGPPGWSPQCFGELGRIWTSGEAWAAVSQPSTHSSLPLYLVTVVHVVQFMMCDTQHVLGLMIQIQCRMFHNLESLRVFSQLFYEFWSDRFLQVSFCSSSFWLLGPLMFSGFCLLHSVSTPIIALPLFRPFWLLFPVPID